MSRRNSHTTVCLQTFICYYFENIEMSELDTRLIELVKANPKLYEREVRCTPYDANKKRNSEIWRSIATSLKSDVHACMTRWNHLVTKHRRELIKAKSGGSGSDWTLLPQLNFLQHHHPNIHRNSGDVSRSSLKSIEEIHDEEDPLQEAMDEQLAVAGAPLPAVNPAPAPSAAPVRAEKRIEALLEGLGEANRIKAEKRILAYLCKCNLRALNDEQIDDIVI